MGMRCKAASLLIAVACAGALASPAVAAAAPAPGLLVLSKHELPGFVRARVRLNVTTSPGLYAADYMPDAPPQGAAQLVRLGFQEGVQATFSARRREALSEAVVFGSAQSAEQALAEASARTLSSSEAASLTQSPVPGIPGAVAFADSQAGQPGGTDTVLFASGRCLLTLSDRIFDASPRARVDRAPLAGAYVLDERVEHICA